MKLEGCWNVPFRASSVAGLFERPADGCADDAVSLCDLSEAHAAVAVAENGSTVEVERGATDMTSF